MFPTLVPGQVVWCEARPRAEDLHVGDIVVFGRIDSSLPLSDRITRDRELGIKRLSALPGQPDPAFGRPAPPSGHCEVIGDNTAHSSDSRDFGPIPLRCVLARVIARPRAHRPGQPAAGHAHQR
jgi:signal peptidase I